MLAGWRRCQTSLPALARSIQRSSYSTAPSGGSSSASLESSNGLRQLMRKVAQPVAVITANLNNADKLHQADHGATISSFVSIALHPTPLVAFALRLPSRLATFLNAHHQASNPSSSVSSSSTSLSDQVATFKIHLLSEEQEDVARAFARQAPLPNKAMPSSSSAHQHEPFSPELFRKLEATSLGSLECSLAGDLPLVEPLFQTGQHSEINNLADKTVQNQQAKANRLGQATSQLFIAKIIKVNEGDTSRHPLLYYHQKYCVLDME